MGTAASAIAGDEDVDVDAGSEHALAAEEWLVSNVLEYVADAREVCRLALVNKNFWAASLSDPVWQRRLPPKFLLDAVSTPDALLAPTSSKRDLYIHLCKSIFYENGLKKFWLDPASGGDCHMISARALSIIWGDSPQYWQWKPWPDAMFPEVAYLHTVCWFSIEGTFRQTLRPGKYMVSYRMQVTTPQAGWGGSPIKLCLQNKTYAHPSHRSQVLFDSAVFKSRFCPLPNTPFTSQTPTTSLTETLVHPQVLNFDDLNIGCVLPEARIDPQVLNFDDLPDPCIFGNPRIERQGWLSTFAKEVGTFFPRHFGRVMRSTRPPKAESQAATSAISETISGSDDGAAYADESSLETFEPFRSSRGSPSKWVECDAGEFIVDDDNEGRPIEIQFSMQEIEVLWWKGGFVLDGVIIRPSNVAKSMTIK